MDCPFLRSRTVSSILPYRSSNANNHERFGQQVPANWECLWQEKFCAVVDVAGNCGNHMTGDRAESNSVHTSSQSWTRHPKVHCVANLALRTEDIGLSHRASGPHPTAHLRSIQFFFFCWINIHVNIIPGHAWAIPAAPIVCRQHSEFCVFRQDCALPHFAQIVHNYFETFPGCWIGRGSPRFWEALSRDLTPLDFFARGHITTQVNKVKIRDL